MVDFKNSLENVQAKFSNFTRNLKLNLSLPEFKFLKDSIKGILSSKSVIVRQTAECLNESILLKKTSERLYRNLRKSNLDIKLSDTLLGIQSRKLDKDSIISVDDSDIIKPSAKQMEGLYKVRDGSTGEYELGYHLINISGVANVQGDISLVPISSTLFSNSLEIDSKTNLTLDKITDITVKSGNKGIFTFDRGYDSRKFIKQLIDNENAFIIRSKGTRNILIDEKLMNFKDACKKVKLKYSVKSGKDEFSAGMQKIRISLDNHPKKNPLTADLYLVVSRYRSSHKKGYFYFLCSFPNRNWADKEIIAKAIKGYRLRWKIEELHRHLKQEYNWEGLQLQSYQSLKNMNTIFWIAISFLYSLKSMLPKLKECLNSFFIEKKSDWYDTKKFIYYRLGRAIGYIFKYAKTYKKNRFKGKYNEQLQLKLKFE